MNNFLYYILILSSLLLAQNNIHIKQYSIYKSKHESSIDLRNYIQDYNGNYILKLVSINDIDYERKKKILIELCDLDFTISSKLNEINIKRCDNVLLINGEIFLNDNNSIISFDNSKYKYLELNFIFWIYGSFNNNSDEKIEDGLLKEYYDSGNLKLEYKYNNGKKNGLQKKWHDNKQLAINYNYINGRLDGLQKKWYRNGNIQSEINYYDDILDGISKYWYSNRQLKFIKLYKNGDLVETLESYDIDGNPQ